MAYVKREELQHKRLLFRDFTGERYGRCTCNPIIDNISEVHRLMEAGWVLKPSNRLNDNGEPEFYHIPCELRFDQYPPKVTCIYIQEDGSKIFTDLDAATIGELQSANIVEVSMIISPYTCRDGHIKAYVQQMVAVVDKNRRVQNDNLAQRLYGVDDEEGLPFD